jgi:hypothetical protein
MMFFLMQGNGASLWDMKDTT